MNCFLVCFLDFLSNKFSACRFHHRDNDQDLVVNAGDHSGSISGKKRQSLPSKQKKHNFLNFEKYKKNNFLNSFSAPFQRGPEFLPFRGHSLTLSVYCNELFRRRRPWNQARKRQSAVRLCRRCDHPRSASPRAAATAAAADSDAACAKFAPRPSWRRRWLYLCFHDKCRFSTGVSFFPLYLFFFSYPFCTSFHPFFFILAENGNKHIKLSLNNVWKNRTRSSNRHLPKQKKRSRNFASSVLSIAKLVKNKMSMPFWKKKKLVAFLAKSMLLFHFLDDWISVKWLIIIHFFFFFF